MEFLKDRMIKTITRVANLTFTYRFGNNKVQAARRRTTASEEERQRAGDKPSILLLK